MLSTTKPTKPTASSLSTWAIIPSSSWTIPIPDPKSRRSLANTHKDNNEIPLRAREVLPGNRKDFSNYWNLLFYSHGSLSSGMRRCHRCDFTTFPIRRKPIYLGIEILLDQHNRGNCKVREEPHKSCFRLVDDFQKCFFDCVCQFQLLRSSQCI